MKYCPYCHNLIEENDSFCVHCNKPLIGTDPLDELNHLIESKFQENEFLAINPAFEEVKTDFSIIANENIEKDIYQLDLLIEQDIAEGESISDLLLKKASLFYKKRDLDNTVKILGLALDNFIHENDDFKIAITHNEIGIMQEEMGFFDQAVYHFNYAIEIFEKLNDQERIIQVYNNLANVFFTLKEIEKSYEFYNKALEISRKHEFKSYEIKTSSNLIDVLFILKEYDRIQSILDRNLFYFKGENDLFGIINTCIKLGKLYYEKGQDFVEEAFNALNTALDLIEKINGNNSLIIKAQLEWECYFYLGLLDSTIQNYMEAESFLLKSLEAVRNFEIGDNIKEGLVLDSIGTLYRNLKDFYKSIEYYELAGEIFYKYGDDIKLANIIFIIADIYYHDLKIFSKAIDNLNKALDIYKKKNYRHQCAKILSILGEIYIDEQLYDLSINYFEDARKFYYELEDNYHVKLLKEKINSLNNLLHND